MLKNNMLVEFLESNGFNMEVFNNLAGCKCEKCQIMSDILDNLEEGIQFNIEDIDGTLEDTMDYNSYNEATIFQSCVDCINDYSLRLYCKYCNYHERFEIDTEFVFVNSTENCYCQESEGEAWITCSECGEIIECEDSIYNEYDDNFYCSDCYSDNNWLYEEYVYGYHEFDNYIPIGESPNGIYYGFEIETCSDNLLDNLESFINNCSYYFPNWQNYFHIEEDCSISGFEFVSQPLSMDILVEVLPRITHILKDSGFYVNNTCGSHIHITKTEQVKDKLFNMITFLNYNRFFTIYYSDRDRDKMKEYADFWYTDNAILKQIANEQRYGGRYKIINVSNSNTIEFRLFSGTLSYNRLFANVELINCLLNENIDGLSSYIDLYQYSNKYPYMTIRLKEIDKFLC